MPTLPSTLALETIDDGSQIIASEHRNNYTAIQQRINDLLGILDDGVTGQFLKGVGTTVSYAYPSGHEFGRTEFTANVNVTATSRAAADTVVTAPAIVFDGVTSIFVEFSCVWVRGGSTGTTDIALILFDGATDKVRFAYNQGDYAPAGTFQIGPLTPSAASHTYSVRAWVATSGPGQVGAGTGADGGDAKGYIRIVKA